MRRLFVAGNWKMNTTQKSAVGLAESLVSELPAEVPEVEVAVCPPFPYLLPVGAKLAGSGIALGAQNVYFEGPGAFTGEVAVEMLQDVGCRYVILGHSERRQILGESNELVNQKLRAAIAKGLDVILCVGELLAERKANETEKVLDAQMEGSLAGVEGSQFSRLVLAYEPVWAIGTGLTASPDQAQSAHAHLRNWVRNRYNSQIAENLRILYGGSVKAENGQSLLQQPDVDGALVGGASLKVDQFLPIVRIAQNMKKA
jgi:triosephosphate isomerase (TIM)